MVHCKDSGFCYFPMKTVDFFFRLVCLKVDQLFDLFNCKLGWKTAAEISVWFLVLPGLLGVCPICA